MFIYENEKGDYINIAYDAEDYFLKEISGIDGLENEFDTIKGFNQDGINIVNSNVRNRAVTITGSFVANENLVDNLKNTFNLKRSGILYNKKNGECRKLNCMVESMPKFRKGSGIWEFTVDLLAPDPYFYDNTETIVKFSSVTPLLEFPIEFTNTIEFSTLDTERSKKIINDGDVAAALDITFIASGTVTDPELISSEIDIRNRNKKLKLDVTLNNGDRVNITTGYNNKKVTIYREDGTVENGLKYINDVSVFMELQTGETTFAYNAAAGIENLGIEFKFIKKYVGAL